ncbi:MAG: hypothetical protein LBI39_04295 [Puniceicoccales bacterium]|jgi:hypothetical protein|nr:hypothetical protein [Puniceicoccales bacterium]
MKFIHPDSAHVVADAPSTAAAAARQCTDLKLADFCWTAAAVIITAAFAVLFLASLIAPPVAISTGAFLFMVFSGYFGAFLTWPIVTLLRPKEETIKLAVVNWKALEIAETNVGADATIEGDCKEALEKRFEAIRAGCGRFQKSFERLEKLLDAIGEQEKAVIGAANNSEERRVAELRLGNCKRELNEWADNDSSANAAYAIRNAEEESKKDRPNRREVVRWLLCAENFLRHEVRHLPGSERWTSAYGDSKAEVAYGAIRGALQGLGIDPDAADKIREPGAFDEILRDLGDWLSSRGG